ncbi:TonB-dependent receptor domain-containing protein [Halomonas organivorans]|uniref:Outer membrane receptor for ferrienterochelin and colicins n=1 Tax=Halomonas organivorans TaxID=257772 RepID=A0A7W5BYK2_9GAMM|nr:TonB-dependent receptor [Halomonas organivorans]MBB3141537.1 outer membrane receptor for ferrienterochelin and colicins [Halomonas organivorans]
MQDVTPLPFTRTALALGIAAACASGGALADDATELEPVVVTASGYEQALSDAPASISVISGEELNKQSYSDITDAVDNIPGVYVTGGGLSKDISIRGMDDSYTLYLIDGRPINDGRLVNTNGTDGGKQIGLPPISMIERIEVIRGPMSSLYGSQAMGGVINVITKKVTDEWTGSVTTEYTHSLNDINSDAQQVSFFTGGALIEGLLGAQFHGSWIGNEESDFIGGDDNAESTPDSDTRQGGVKLILTPDDSNEFTLGYTSSTKEYTHTPGRSMALVDSRGNPTEASTTRYDKDVYTLSHSGSYGSFLTDTYLQHDISDRHLDEASEEKTNEMTTFNTQSTYFWGNHMLTFGGQYKYEDLTDDTNGLLSSNVPGAVNSVDRWLASLFVEMEWGITDALNLTTGLRYDDDELFGGHLSPRVYANYHLTPEWTLKGGVSTGYKQPSLSDATEGFGRGTGGGGSPAPHPRALIIGNEDLDPETSTNYEFGFAYNNAAGNLNASATLFHTRFEDKIAEERLCETANADRNDPSTWACPYSGNDFVFLSTRQNIDEAVMQGVELSLGYDITPRLNVTSSYTFTDSEQKSGEFEGEPLNKIPEHMFNVLLDWEATEDLNLWVQNNIRSGTSDYLGRSSMSDGTPGYGFVDAGLVYALNDNARVKAGIYNIADKEITNDDYEVVLDGRQLNLGLTVDF